MTEDDKMHINQYIINRLKEEDIKEYTCIELIMNSIKKDTIICNPGILGSGILATNFSQESSNKILDFSSVLVNTYIFTRYKNYDGSLYRCIIEKSWYYLQRMSGSSYYLGSNSFGVHPKNFLKTLLK